MTPCDVTIEDDGIVVGLDDIVVVDKSYVYMLCPYLKVIKKPLSDFKKKVRLDNNTGRYWSIRLFWSYLWPRFTLFSFTFFTMTTIICLNCCNYKFHSSHYFMMLEIFYHSKKWLKTKCLCYCWLCF